MANELGSLSGFRIVELGSAIASSKACMMLADNGASVIKVETPAEAERPRHRGYYVWNRGKTCLTLDIRTEAGLAELMRLVDGADAAVFDQTQERLSRYGLNAAVLQLRFPSLLIVSMPPFGEAGPLRHLPEEEILIAAATGVSMAQYSYGDVPVHLVIPLVSYGQALAGAAAIAAGVYERGRSGLGQHLVVSGLHGVVVQEAGANVGAGDDGMTIRRGAGRDSRGTLPYLRMYECKDGEWIFLVGMTGGFIVKVLTALGLDDLLSDPRFADGFRYALRVPEIARVVEDRIAAAFKARPREDWLRIAAEEDLPMAPVLTREEWFDSEQVRASGMRVSLMDPEVGAVEMPGLPLDFSVTKGRVRRRSKVDRADWESPRRGEGSRPAGMTVREVGAAGGGPLAGVTVLDLTFFVAGPVCSSVLADFGANVIKVEPVDGDPNRPYRLTFLGWNRGKRSLAIDLKSPDGVSALHDLVRQADVIVDSYRPPVSERLGIDYETLSKINPSIISCSITAYGTKGPLAGHPGFDPLMQARSGMQEAQGGGEEPVFLQIGINDTGTGVVAAFGVIAALLARDRTGQGQRVETCLANQSVLGQSGEMARYSGAPAPERGSRDHPGRSALYRLYECANRSWIAIACTEAAHFEQLSGALGHEEWATEYDAPAALAAPVRGELADRIAGALADLSAADAAAALRAKGVPCVQALRLERELFEDPHLLANDFWTRFQGPEGEPLTVMTHWAHWSRAQAPPPPPGPPLGAHSVEILREAGFAPDRIRRLCDQKVVHEASEPVGRR